MKIISIQVGQPQTVEFRGKEITTGIFKFPVAGPSRVTKTNIEGDGQADLSVHGGVDKAVYAFSTDAYALWKNARPQDDLTDAAFGENLTVDRFDEKQIYVGDTFEVGDVILQAAQPRFPCFKLGVKFNDPSVLPAFNKLGRCGIYFRVLREGLIQSGLEMKLIDRESERVSIHELFLKYPGRHFSGPEIDKLLKIRSLPEKMRMRLRSLRADD